MFPVHYKATRRSCIFCKYLDGKSDEQLNDDENG